MIAVVTPWHPKRVPFIRSEVDALDAFVASPRMVPGIPRVLSQLWFLLATLPWLFMRSPSVIHGYIGAYGGLAAVIYKRVLGARVVVHEMACPPGRFCTRRWELALVSWVHRNADAVRVVSESVRLEVESWSGRNASVVPCIAWSGEKPSTVENGLGLPRFLYASWFYKRKGADVVAAAVARARAAGAQFEFMALGSGPEEPALRALNGQSWVHARPSRDGYLQWLNWADVVLCPSREESFGVTAFEAAANGCAVVATRTGAHGDLIDLDAAHEVPVGDITALAEVFAKPPRRPEQWAVQAVRQNYGAERIGQMLRGLA